MITGYIEEGTEPENKTADPKDYGCFHDVQFVIPRGTAFKMSFSLRGLHSVAPWLEAAGRVGSAPFRQGDSAFFGIKKHPSDETYLYTLTAVPSSSGALTVRLNESDTDREPGIYYYSVAIRLENGSPGFFEVIPPTPLRIRSMMIRREDLDNEE